MNISRNSPCQCGSGLKYKKCCFLKEKYFDPLEAIAQIVKEQQYPDVFAQIIIRLFNCIKINKWQGACHASSAALFVALNEIGFSPTLCIGEVEANGLLFDHSWIELDGKVVDIAIAFPLLNQQTFNVTLLGVDIFTKAPPKIIYGTSRGRGLDLDAYIVTQMQFCEYMDNYSGAPRGLWSIAEYLIGKTIDISAARAKYSSTEWQMRED